MLAVGGWSLKLEGKIPESAIFGCSAPFQSSMLANPWLPLALPPEIWIEGTYRVTVSDSKISWYTSHPVPHTLLTTGARMCCVPHRHTPHNSAVFICRGRSCHSLAELPEPLWLEPALCCCSRQGPAARNAMPGVPVSPRDMMLWRQHWGISCTASLLACVAPWASAAVTQMEIFGIHNLL